MANFENKKHRLKTQLSRARRNAHKFYHEYMRYQGGSFTHGELKRAISEKYNCSASVKSFDRLRR